MGLGFRHRLVLRNILELSYTSYHYTIVNFDLDVGPVVCGVYPPFYLAPAEKENM
jgi:hypothetical protein